MYSNYHILVVCDCESDFFRSHYSVLFKKPFLNMLDSMQKTNSLSSLCLSVWMCLCLIPLSPHSLQNLVIFVGFSPPHHSSCGFSPSCFILALLSSFFFFLPTFSSLYCVIVSLYHSVLPPPPLSFSSFTPPPPSASLILLQQKK